jgi:hypothetical protein
MEMMVLKDRKGLPGLPGRKGLRDQQVLEEERLMPLMILEEQV